MISEAVKTEVQMQVSVNAKNIWRSIDRQVKRGTIKQIMHETHNNQSAAAAALGISSATLRVWIGQVFTDSEIREMGIGV